MLGLRGTAAVPGGCQRTGPSLPRCGRSAPTFGRQHPKAWLRPGPQDRAPRIAVHAGLHQEYRVVSDRAEDVSSEPRASGDAPRDPGKSAEIASRINRRESLGGSYGSTSSRASWPQGRGVDHSEGVVASHRGVGQLPTAGQRAEEGAFLLVGDACGFEVGVHVRLGVVVGGNLVAFAAFLVEPEPPSFSLLAIVFDPHAD